MAVSDLVLLEADHTRFASILDRLRHDSNAKVVFLIDKNGQQLATAGDLTGLDPTSLASLTAGNVAATDGLAKLLGEREFSILFHEGEHDNLHINVVSRDWRSPTAAICWPFLSTRNTTLAFASEASLCSESLILRNSSS